ncbi:MAG: right-handed parallel beta-helix repeat-containing protein [Methanococcoides sp.]|nr:right-handed parallel beta-helix repeat-containing protein [Methanococcoides sp.]
MQMRGDKIIVCSGIYEENVIVNKQLTLQGVENPVIDANGFGNPINLYAGNSVVVLCNGRSGLYMVSKDNVIKNNTIKENQYGIYLFKSRGNIIEQNLIDGNLRNGLYLLIKSNNNVISGNMINDNNGSIRIIASDDNKISLNSIFNNSVVSKGDLQWDNGIGKGRYYSFFDEGSEGFIDTVDDNSQMSLTEYQ